MDDDDEIIQQVLAYVEVKSDQKAVEESVEIDLAQQARSVCVKDEGRKPVVTREVIVKLDNGISSLFKRFPPLYALEGWLPSGVIKAAVECLRIYLRKHITSNLKRISEGYGAFRLEMDSWDFPRVDKSIVNESIQHATVEDDAEVRKKDKVPEAKAIISALEPKTKAFKNSHKKEQTLAKLKSARELLQNLEDVFVKMRKEKTSQLTMQRDDIVQKLSQSKVVNLENKRAQAIDTDFIRKLWLEVNQKISDMENSIGNDGVDKKQSAETRRKKKKTGKAPKNIHQDPYHVLKNLIQEKKSGSLDYDDREKDKIRHDNILFSWSVIGTAGEIFMQEVKKSLEKVAQPDLDVTLYLSYPQAVSGMEHSQAVLEFLIGERISELQAGALSEEHKVESKVESNVESKVTDEVFFDWARKMEFWVADGSKEYKKKVAAIQRAFLTPVKIRKRKRKRESKNPFSLFSLRYVKLE